MDKIIVYLDDASYALPRLEPLRKGPTHWVLVACAPRMTQRIGKWVSHSAREKWRTQWAAKLFTGIEPVLRGTGDEVTTLLAKGPLPPLTLRLMAEHGPCRVADARRPKFGQELAPIAPEQPAGTPGRWHLPGTIVGMGAALVLAAE